MPQLTFAFARNELRRSALVSVDSNVLHQLVSQGKPLAKPIQVRAQIDTGTLVTAVCPRILSAIGAVTLGSSKTQTAGGLVNVQLYSVSFTIYDSSGGSGVSLTRATWLVTDLPQNLPDVDVLFGMDLVRELVLHIDGPAGEFTLIF